MELSRQSVAWVSSLEFPDFEQDYEFVALRTRTMYTRSRTRRSPARLGIGPGDSEEHFTESRSGTRRRSSPGCAMAAPTSSVRWPATAELRAALGRGAGGGGGGPALGPQSATRSSRSWSVRWRSSTLVEALRLIADYEPPAPPAVEMSRAGWTGWGEAAKMLWHRLPARRTTAPSRRRGSCLLPPRIRPESSRTCSSSCGPASTYRRSAEWECEQAIRNYDPCISCSTHFLKLEVDRA